MHNESIIKVKEFISKDSSKGKSLTSKINGFLKYYHHKIQLLDIQYQRTDKLSSALLTYKMNNKDDNSNVYLVRTPNGTIWFSNIEQYNDYLASHGYGDDSDIPLMPEFD